MSLKTLRIYVENSVIGGYFEKEFEESTKELFELFRQGVYIPVLSSHVIDELDEGAPEHVKNLLLTINFEKYILNDIMIKLADKYLEQKVVSEKYRGDALHIAIATVLGVDILVSWNFKHIVNLNRIKMFNSVNLREGFNSLEIRTPKEVVFYE